MEAERHGALAEELPRDEVSQQLVPDNRIGQGAFGQGIYMNILCGSLTDYNVCSVSYFVEGPTLRLKGPKLAATG